MYLNICLFLQKPIADIKAPLFTVLGNVLLYNWRHFFKSSVMRSLIGAQSPMPQGDQVKHKVHFLAILNAFGQSFLQPDIVVFKQNLITLEKLNEKWKLYHKVSYYFSGIILLFENSRVIPFDSLSTSTVSSI